MNNLILPVIAELLNFGQVSSKETANFANDDWKHNDVLCPMLHQKLETIRESFRKFQSEAYDIQGVHDQGTDVMLQYLPSDDFENGQKRVIAFQVKSHNDLKNKNYLKDLRSQYTQARMEYRDRLDRYFVVLCADSNKHKNQIREVSKALSTADDVAIIYPRFAMRFFKLHPRQIHSVVDMLVREQDEVLLAAKRWALSLTPTQVALAIAATAEVTFAAEGVLVDLDELLDSQFVQSVYEMIPDYEEDAFPHLAEVSRTVRNRYNEAERFEFADMDEDEIREWEAEVLDDVRNLDRTPKERWIEDVDILTNDIFSLRGGENQVGVELEFVRPIQALMLDAHVRHGYSGLELNWYLFELLRVTEGLEIGHDFVLPMPPDFEDAL